MQLRKIKRAEKKGTESVMDEKFSLLFQSKFSVGGGELVFQVRSFNNITLIIILIMIIVVIILWLQFMQTNRFHIYIQLCIYIYIYIYIKISVHKDFSVFVFEKYSKKIIKYDSKLNADWFDGLVTAYRFGRYRFQLLLSFTATKNPTLGRQSLGTTRSPSPGARRSWFQIKFRGRRSPRRCPPNFVQAPADPWRKEICVSWPPKPSETPIFKYLLLDR